MLITGILIQGKAGQNQETALLIPLVVATLTLGRWFYQADNWPEIYRDRLFTLNFHGRRANPGNS